MENDVKSDLIDIMVEKHAETDKAVLVSDDGDNEKAVWIPKSQCEIVPSKINGIFEITLPEWLAKDKGLI